MNKPSIEVCLSPLLLHLHKIEGKTVVIIDILRATSTIVTALENGAESVIPVDRVDTCLLYSSLDDHICAAEREGEKPEGFKYGNSPLDFVGDHVRGKHLVLTTTNGTRAIKMSAGAGEILVGAFLNISALCEFLIDEGKDVVLFCAGWKHHVNFEDSLFAGAVVDALKHDFISDLDSTLAVRYLYRNLKDRMRAAVKFASHYKRLSHLGVIKDIDFCLQRDYSNIVPRLYEGAIVSEATKITQDVTRD